MNEKYERAVLEIEEFHAEDVIATSPTLSDPEEDYQVPIR